MVSEIFKDDLLGQNRNFNVAALLQNTHVGKHLNGIIGR